MKKAYLTSVAVLLFASCGDDVKLPPIDAETDLFKIPLPLRIEIPLKDESVAMVHDGAMHTAEDFQRIRQKLDAGESPWVEGYQKLANNSHAKLTWTPNPQTSITRGTGSAENYSIAFNDAAAAYQLALRWKIDQNDAFATHAVSILNGWAAKCTVVNGTTDAALAAGIYGYQFAVAGEILRDFAGWGSDDFRAYQNWMVNVFYTFNSRFLDSHFETPPLHYWANWGLCNIASMMAIGILADRRDIYNEAIEHFQIGETSGRFTNTILHVFDGDNANLAQWQEANRDMGHTYMCIGLVGTICQLAWVQGDDFFGYHDNLFLKGCEYIAKYNIAMQEVPNVPYTREYKASDYATGYEEYPVIAGRLDVDRPIWALPYYHYAKVSGVSPDKYQYTKMGMEKYAPEGGGGDYGPNSGHYDALGFGTLMFAR